MANTAQTATDSPAEQSDPAREYIRIVPAEGSVGLAHVTDPFRELHSLLEGTADSFRDWLWGLLGVQQSATLECILVTEGANAPVRYLFGVDDPQLLTGLEGLFRQLFPRTYDIDRVDHTGDWLGAGPDSDLFGVEYFGRVERARDWRTQLTPCDAFEGNAQSHLPLATITETMAEARRPMVYQALLQPLGDLSFEGEYYASRIRPDEYGASNSATASTDSQVSTALTQSDQQRLTELEARNLWSPFCVNARVVGVAPDEADGRTVQRRFASLESAMAAVGKTSYQIATARRTGSAADTLYQSLQARRFYPRNYSRLRDFVPFASNRSRGIVADPSEAPSFCLLSGRSLSTKGTRAVEPTPQEQTTLPRPSRTQLATYHGDGLPLGSPLTDDGQTDDQPVVLPTALQPMHLAWFGKSGSGKSTALTRAILDNHAATDGLDVLVDPKGDNMPIEYLRSHYDRFGTLDNVLYFDCSELLPAFSFFDIRPELADGVPRAAAVEDTIDHYLEILKTIMGADRFEQAVRAPDVIQFLLKALFDPVTGSDAFTHREFHEEARRMQDRQTAPSVSDDSLEQMLEGVLEHNARSFRNIMNGVLTRIEKIPVDSRLGRIFNHVPASLDEGSPDEPDTVAHLDLADYLDEDAVIIFDTGGLRTEAQRVLALVIISNLWTALRRRKRTRVDGADGETATPDAHTDERAPLVNLYLEEAASLAVSDLVGDLLAQGRSFDCSVTLAMQFPGQLKADARRSYEEVLNNVSTVVTGNVAQDVGLGERLATDEMSPEAVHNRLSSIRRGRWLVDLPAAYDTPAPRPFLVESLDPPAAHPASEPTARCPGFPAALEQARERTAQTAGLDLGLSAEDTGDPAELQDRRVDTALVHTSRMPPSVSYHDDSDSLRCTGCDNRYAPDARGMRRAINCCESLQAVDRADIPICELSLKLSPAERQASPWTDHQLMFLQAVYNAEQLRYDPLEYDIVNDSMLRLRDDVGIDDEAIEPLTEAGLLRHETDYPHRLFTVTPDGREAIGESYRAGVDFGHGQGDLTESSEHVMLVEVGRRYLETAYVADPSSPVQTVEQYYQVDGNTRLDLVGLDADDEIVVALEAERPTTDARNEVPVDFDKMAAVDPTDAIWIAPGKDEAHTILDALANPMDGPPRVEKTYSDTTPTGDIDIEAPGLTDIFTFLHVRDTKLAD